AHDCGNALKCNKINSAKRDVKIRIAKTQNSHSFFIASTDRHTTTDAIKDTIISSLGMYSQLLRRCAMKHIIVSLLSILLTSSWVCCIEESFCAGTGYRDGNGVIKGARSAGWSKLIHGLLSRIWAANHANAKAANDVPHKIIMDIRKVEEGARGANSELNGWLQINIKVVDTELTSVVMAVWALTDTRESIGEFVSTKSAQCSGSGAPTPTDAKIVPCAAAPINEPNNPNMFVHVAKNENQTLDEFNLLWKTSVSYCNFPKKFRVAANTIELQKFLHGNTFYLTDPDKGHRIYASRWLSPKCCGPAAAPLFNQNNLKCSSSIKFSRPQWIKSITGTPTADNSEWVELEEEWINNRWAGDDRNPQQQDSNVSKRRGCKPNDGLYSFAGRCTAKVGNSVPQVSKTALHKCDKNDNLDTSDLSNLQGKYEDYLKEREKILKERCGCPPIPTAEEVRKAAGMGRKRRVADIDVDNESANVDHDKPIVETGTEAIGRANFNHSTPSRPRSEGNKEIDPPVRPYGGDLLAKCSPHDVKNGSFSIDEQGLCVNSQPGRVSYGVRQWHAVSILFCVVVNPVTSYIARFLKGTFSFTGKTPIPIKTWYTVHIAIVLPMVCMYTTGMSAIFRQRPVLGYSYSGFAEFHQRAGYFLFVVGFFEVISGMVRPRNVMMRRVVIGLHWFGGVLMNYVGLIVCILSYRIPASPTAFVSHVNRKMFESIWSHMAPLILVGWGIVDVFYQAFVMIHVLLFDRKFRIKRPHFPIIIPIMVDHHQMRVHDEFEVHNLSKI
ncbi:hypothetical protein Ocin01_08383, partial [Orchesella cincta]